MLCSRTAPRRSRAARRGAPRRARPAPHRAQPPDDALTRRQPLATVIQCLCADLARERRRFYSPCLHVHFGAAERGQRTLLGRFAPHPNVWTGFMAGYGVLTMFALLSLAYGYVQWTMHHAPYALLGFPLAAALIGFEHGAAFIGQGLGAEQMYALRKLLDTALSAAEGDDGELGSTVSDELALVRDGGL